MSSVDPPFATAAGPQTPASWLGDWWPRVRPVLFGALGLAFVLVIGFALHALLREVRYAGVLAAMEQL